MRKSKTAIVLVAALLTSMFLIAMPIVKASTLEVGPGKPYTTIQDAIDAAGPGDTVLVYPAPGPYAPFNVSGKTDLAVIAQSVGIVVNGSQSVATHYSNRDAVIFVSDSVNVTIQGFDIEGYGLGTTNPKSYGVIYQNSSGTIRDCTVSPNTIDDMNSVAIGAWDNSNLTIDPCTIKNFGRIGVFYFNNCTGIVRSNTIIGQPYSANNEVVYGIEVESYYDGPCSVEISDNEIYNCTNTNASPLWSSAGIVIDGWRAFYDLSPSTVAIERNNLHDNYYGVETVANNMSYAHYNNIHDNLEYGVISDPDYNGNNTAFDARLNYWGNSNGPGLTGPGEGDNVSGYVDFEPWLSCYAPYTGTLLYIDPSTINKLSLDESTTFEVKVIIVNVTDLYGFDLKLTWNDTLLDLVSVEYQAKLNNMWTNWYASRNETGAGWYRLVAFERIAKTGFSGPNATLLSLVFHVKYGPGYIEKDYQLSTRIHFALVKLSDSNSAPICSGVQDANYYVTAVKPKLEIRTSMSILRKSRQTIAFEVWLLNASKICGFEFNITYDPNVLEAINVDWGSFLQGPYYSKSWRIDKANGVIQVSLEETNDAPLANGNGLLVNITFHPRTIIWKDCLGWNNYLNCTVAFNYWKLCLRTPDHHEITGDLVGIGNADYSYVPVKGDVNSDGEVDVVDLRIIAMYYDQPKPEFDLNCDGTIDVFDLIYVATNFGFKVDC